MWPFIFSVNLEFSYLSYQTSESFLLKLRPATHLDNALLHSSRASSKVRMLKSNIQGTHKNPSKSAISSSPPLSTRLPNSAFHYWYPNLYSKFHPLLPQLHLQCYLCCSLFQYSSDQSSYSPLALTLPHQPISEREQRQRHTALTVQKSLVRTEGFTHLSPAQQAHSSGQDTPAAILTVAAPVRMPGGRTDVSQLLKN